MMTPLPKDGIERLFGIQIHEALRVRNAYRLETDAGRVFLKKSRLSEKELVFVTTALDYLATSGFGRAPVLVKTRAGDSFACLEGNRYLLTQWREGRECDFDIAHDAADTAELLACLHRESAGFQPPAFEPRIRYVGWPRVLRRRLRDLDLFARVARARGQPTEVDREYLARYEENLAAGREALNWLEATDASLVVYRARQRHTICHHDVAHHNVIREPGGRLSFVDFDYALCDLPVHDVANFLRRILRRNGWDPGKGTSLIERYAAKRPLSREEYALLAALLWWPQEFWQVAFQYYVEHHPWPPERFLDGLRKKAVRPESQRAFVDLLWAEAHLRP